MSCSVSTWGTNPCALHNQSHRSHFQLRLCAIFVEGIDPGPRNVSRTLSVQSANAVDTVERLQQRLGEVESRLKRAKEIASAPGSSVEVGP